MTSTPVIRRANLREMPSVLDVAIGSYCSAYSYLYETNAQLSRKLSGFRQAIDADFRASFASTWIAEVDGQIIGMMQCIFPSPIPVGAALSGVEIRRLYILEPGHAKGVGFAMSNCAARWAITKSSKIVWLDVMESAQKAREAYERWGFKPVGEISFNGPTKPGLDRRIVMVKDLANQGTQAKLE